jgi:hypothetical protein
VIGVGNLREQGREESRETDESREVTKIGIGIKKGTIWKRRYSGSEQNDDVKRVIKSD